MTAFGKFVLGVSPLIPKSWWGSYHENGDNFDLQLQLSLDDHNRQMAARRGEIYEEIEDR